MSIDVSQFHQVFFEESFEGLDAMESGLLNLQPGDSDVEAVNTIFRAAHSIKGGAGTFGFTDITDFTHVMETLLDEVRNGQREITSELINNLLEAVDVLREMLTAVDQDSEQDMPRIQAVKDKLEAELDEAPVAATETATPAEAGNAETAGWRIDFRPHAHLLQTGNDPVRMFRELAELGELTVEADTQALPDFADMEPEDAYLSWQLTLHGEDIPREEIDEVFEWVEDDCDLVITPLQGEAITDPTDEAPEPAAAPESTVARTEEPKADAESAPAKSPTASSSIRVATDKIDSLINLVGELVITQSMLSQVGEDFDESKLTQLADGLSELERNSRELQEGIMRIRMLPISFAFNRFPRLVHDLSAQMGKQVELKLSGEQTELDKTVMEKIGDPLVHLVRNSLDHGLEMPEERRAAGKDETGLLHLDAYHQGGNIVIEIHDDGAGLNEEKILSKALERELISADDNLSADQIHDLIFLPGFSTADAVSDISGRGVGMDVVRKNINSLGGSIEVKSERGQGSTFTIRLPLTLAIMDGQTIQVADERYILPLISIVESLEIKSGEIKRVSGKGELYSLRDEYIPVIRLYEIFDLEPRVTDLEKGLLVVVEGDNQKVGLFIDDLLGQQQVVIKSLETNYRKVTGLSGATILGDGTVALILDVPGLAALYRHPPKKQPDSRAA